MAIHLSISDFYRKIWNFENLNYIHALPQQNYTKKKRVLSVYFT